MHTSATAPCSTQQGNIVLKQIKLDLPYYRVTGEVGTPIDPTVAYRPSRLITYSIATI